MKTKADLSSVALRYWWACAVAWLGLTVVGLTIGSPDPTDKSVANQLSNVMLAGSVLAGLIATWLTMRLVNSVDAAESAVAYGRPA